ncbi:hypothetical protein B0O99DRAFT_588865 [Bisporella sp. PMI_857]|nr:hypothetical protein B0O99DRAFT_588865 [Bisporella sp. PMI_857]
MEKKRALDSVAPTRIPKDSKSRTSLSLSQDIKQDLRKDLWDKNFRPESPPPLPAISFDDPFPAVPISADEFKSGSLKFKSSRNIARKGLTFHLSEGDLRTLQELKSANSSTSTLFKDPQHEITIVLTTPEDEIPQPTFSEAIKSGGRARNSSVTSLPAMSLQQSRINTTLLMPPSDKQLDPRKLRQEQEIKEVRKWLINFINSKGDTFPRKVRQRMMDAYSIREFDLAPEAVAKFSAAERDEGVSIDNLDELDPKEGLRLLNKAFQSQIGDITPRGIDRTPLPIPRTKKNSKPVTPRAKPVLVTITDDEEPPPTWLGPLISTSMNSRDSLLNDPQFLKKSYSTPNLHKGSRPPKKKHESSGSIPTVASVREDLKRREKAFEKEKRGSGFWGKWRERLGGESDGVRALKKKSMLAPAVI